jgi:hypothetical protein
MSATAHPCANIFPLLEGEPFDALIADIRTHGLREPITLTADGLILDGRNRYRACRQAKIEPHYETWDGVGSPLAFVLSRNVHRRHLDESQRAVVAAKVANLPEGRPMKTTPPIGGVSQSDDVLPSM